MDNQAQDAAENYGTPSGFEKIYFKNLDLLIRERVFELVTPRMKYSFRDYVGRDVEMIEYSLLSIRMYSVYSDNLFSNSYGKYIFFDDGTLIEKIRQNNGDIQKVNVSNNEIWNVKDHLVVAEIKPGVISMLSEYILFNHNLLKIYSSKITKNEFELLFNSKITRLSIEKLTILNEHLNELPKEESFGLIQEVLINTKSKVKWFSFYISTLPQNWLQMLYESGCTILRMKIYINSKWNRIVIDSELLHKFISGQDGFEFAFVSDKYNFDEVLDHNFFKFFKKRYGGDRYRNHQQNYLVYKTYHFAHQEIVFDLK